MFEVKSKRVEGRSLKGRTPRLLVQSDYLRDGDSGCTRITHVERVWNLVGQEDTHERNEVEPDGGKQRTEDDVDHAGNLVHASAIFERNVHVLGLLSWSIISCRCYRGNKIEGCCCRQVYWLLGCDRSRLESVLVNIVSGMLRRRHFNLENFVDGAGAFPVLALLGR